MKIRDLKPVVLAMSLSVILVACGNQPSSTEPQSNEAAQNEATETKENESTQQEPKEEEAAVVEEKEEAKETNTEVQTNSNTEVSLKDGTYEASSNGYDRELNVAVTITDGKISDIELLDNHETVPVIQRAFPVLRDRIIEANSPDVDSVSAATISSYGIKQATLTALEEAGLEKGSIEISRSTGYEEDRELTEAEDRTTDILIIGGGPAGLSAAVQAKMDGADKVTIVEKLDILSGNGKFDMDFSDIINTEAMKARGNEVTLEEHKKNYTDKTWDDEERIDAFVNGSAEIDGWLREMGIELNHNFGGEKSTAHMAEEDLYAGNVIQTKLEEKANELGVEILTGTKAVDLIIEDGVAKGAVVEDKTSRYNFNAPSTIIATGGFSSNKDLLAEYIPGAENVPTSNQMGTTGDFITIAKNHNIKLDHMDQLTVFQRILDPRRDLTGFLTDNYIFVNEKGERFIDETRKGLEFGIEMVENRPVYYIFDETAKNSFYRPKSHVEKGYILSADSVKELADAIGCDEVALQKSFDDYNAAVEGNGDDPFREKPGSEIIDTNKTLYYTKITPAIHITKGGININEKSEVKDNDDNIIKGLYAAGEVVDTSGAYSNAVIFGRIAGSSAAENSKN